MSNKNSNQNKFFSKHLLDLVNIRVQTISLVNAISKHFLFREPEMTPIKIQYTAPKKQNHK